MYRSSMLCICTCGSVLTLMHTVVAFPGKKPTKGEMMKMDILQTKEKSEKLSQKGLDAYEYYVLQMIERDMSDSTKPEVCTYIHTYICIA